MPFRSRPQGRRLYFRTRGVAAPQRQDRGSQPTDAHGAERSERSWSIPTSGGSSGAFWSANCSTRASYKTAYRIARDSAPAEKGNYRVDQHFTAGWIALRFLHDPATATVAFRAHSARAPPILTRWRAPAIGKAAPPTQPGRSRKPSASTRTQRITARLITANWPARGWACRISACASRRNSRPKRTKVLANLEVVRAVEILYGLDERDLIAPIFAELGESGTDIAGMAVLGEHGRPLQRRPRHAAARQRRPGARPAAGSITPSRPSGCPTTSRLRRRSKPAVTYSIARQESHFNQKVVSPANAMGLMQVTPIAAKDTAKKFKARLQQGADC